MKGLAIRVLVSYPDLYSEASAKGGIITPVAGSGGLAGFHSGYLVGF